MTHCTCADECSVCHNLTRTKSGVCSSCQEAARQHVNPLVGEDIRVLGWLGTKRREIARLVGVAYKTVCSHLRQAKCQDCDANKPDNGKALCFSCARKAKRTRDRWLDKSGYVRVYRPGHIQASKRGDMFEHRMVMADHLGRALFPNENVHHKDGNRQNNAIENLELWRTSQPAGQRVSDLSAQSQSYS